MSELISIVMPNYNGKRYLKQSIESVRKQTYTNWELLVVDDCSKDGSEKIAAAYEKEDKRIRLIRSPKNQGVALTRNLGIQEAKGEYIALLDNDDTWEPEKLRMQLELLRKTRAEIGYCSYDFIDEMGKEIKRPFLVPEFTNFNKMLVSSVISCSTAMIRSDVLKAHPFDPTYYHEDFVLWMELLKVPYRAVGNREVLAHYRQIQGSRSNNKKNAALERWKVYRNQLHLSWGKSAVAFVRYAVKAVWKYR